MNEVVRASSESNVGKIRKGTNHGRGGRLYYWKRAPCYQADV